MELALGRERMMSKDSSAFACAKHKHCAAEREPRPADNGRRRFSLSLF